MRQVACILTEARHLRRRLSMRLVAPTLGDGPREDALEHEVRQLSTRCEERPEGLLQGVLGRGDAGARAA